MWIIPSPTLTFTTPTTTATTTATTATATTEPISERWKWPRKPKPWRRLKNKDA